MGNVRKRYNIDPYSDEEFAVDIKSIAKVATNVLYNILVSSQSTPREKLDAVKETFTRAFGAVNTQGKEGDKNNQNTGITINWVKPEDKDAWLERVHRERLLKEQDLPDDLPN